MQIQQLRYFAAVAETLSFHKGADRCFVSQPSLSQQIMKLERELGHALFDRMGHRVGLTEAGEALLPKAREILRSLDEVQSHIASSLDEGKGRLSIGAIPTIGPYVLPKTLRAFRKAFPDARLEVHEALTDDLLRLLVEGRVDVGLMSLPVDEERVEVEVLFEEPLLLCAHAKHALARRKRVRMEHLQGEPAIILNTMHCLGEQVRGFCRQGELDQQTACFSTQLGTIQEMVALGLGYSIMPEMCARADSSSVRTYVPFEGEGPARAITACWRKGRLLPRLAREFLRRMRDVH